MGVKFANNAESTLAAGITNVATTLTVAVGEGNNFPIVTSGSGDYFYCTLVDVSGNREIIKVTEHQSGDVFQVIERGADDTSGTAYALGDRVQLRLPKIILEEYRDDIATNTSGVATNVSDISGLDTRITALEGALEAPSGLEMWFYENAPPAGWTINAGPADSLLAVKGGSEDYNVTGGQTAGSWTPTTHTHTGPSHTHTGPAHTHTMNTHVHTTPSHALTVAEMPPHTHTIAAFYPTQQAVNSYLLSVNNVGTQSAATTSSAGSGAAHAHGNTGATDPGDTNSSGTDATGASGTGATGASSAPSTDRQQAAVGCIGTKD